MKRIVKIKSFALCLKISLLAFMAMAFAATVCAQAGADFQKYTKVDPKPFADNSNHWYGISDKHNLVNPRPEKPRYQPTEITNIADNILLFQKANGGWPKNYDVFAVLTEAQKDTLLAAKNILNTTYDNGSTFTHIAVLANVYTATQIDKYKEAAQRGLEYIMASQYKNGGWPQYYPLENNYSRYVTFNDGNFTGIMELLNDIKEGKPAYSFLEKKCRKKLIAAYDAGLDCIIHTQINDAGKPTAWCQQYDEVNLQPTWARKFEPAGICNAESSGVVLFLMGIDHPSKEIVASVQNAIGWFNESKIYNTIIKTIPAEKEETPFRVSVTDKIVVVDSAAPPIWTRFYELKTHRSLFCNRDSKLVYSLAEVLRERRDGYAWYTYAPQKVLNKYPAWEKKWVSNK